MWWGGCVNSFGFWLLAKPCAATARLAPRNQGRASLRTGSLARVGGLAAAGRAVVRAACSAGTLFLATAEGFELLRSDQGIGLLVCVLAHLLDLFLLLLGRERTVAAHRLDLAMHGLANLSDLGH